MDKATILLILNAIFGAFIGLGFLFGLKGLKKAGLRFGFIVFSVVLALFTAHLFTNLILEIKLTIDGTQMPIKEIIISYITKMEGIGELVESSPSIKTLIENIPVMIGNSITFVILTYVYAFVTWIIYLICASAFIKYKTNDMGKPIKYRLLGGLIGVVQGLLLVCVTFMPITGAVGIVQELRQTCVEAEEEIKTKRSPTASIIEDDVPEIVKVIIDAYDSSIINQISSVGNIGQTLFNNIVTVSYKDTTGKEVKISLRDEIINISKVYDNVYYISDNFNSLMNLDLSVKTIKELNYDKIITAVDYAFDSNIIKAALPDIVNYYMDKFAENENENLADLISAIKTELNSDSGVAGNLKNEIIGLVDVVKTIAQSDIIDNIPLKSFGLEDSFTKFENQNLKNILESLSKEDKKVFNQIIDDLFNSKVLNKGALYGINMGVDFLENWFEGATGEESVELGNIDVTSNSNSLKKAEFKSMASSLLNVLNELVDYNFDEVKQDYTILFDMDFSKLVTNAGVMMNAVQNMEVFKNTGIYNKILTELNKTDYAKYTDFEVFKEENIWLNETKTLANSIDKLLSTNVLSYIKHNENSYDISLADLSKVFDALQTQTDVNGKNETLLRQIIAPIYSSKAYQKIIDFGFEKLNGVVDGLGEKIKEGTHLGDMNLKNVHEDTKKENMLSFLDNITIYLSTLDLDKVKKDPFVTILDSDFALLGRCLDSLKDTQLFDDIEKDGVITDGVYKNLVNSLKETDYAQYINFDCLLEENFSFNTELESVSDSVKKLINKEIKVDETTTSSLIKYITDVGDWEVILNNVDKEEISEIFTPLMNSKIFEPIGKVVVNKINEQIKEIVGEEYGKYIDVEQMSDMTPEEIEVVVEIVGTITEIISDVKDENFDICDYIETKSEEELESLANLLNSLQENANQVDESGEQTGVFAGAYDALQQYIEGNLDSEITDIIDQNTDGESGNIDWLQVLADYKDYLG